MSAITAECCPPSQRNGVRDRAEYAARAHINTNESIAAFAVFGVAGVLLGASPGWLNGLSVLWLASRLAHMAFYYANRKPMRSLSFAVSLVSLLGMAATVLLAA